MEIGDKVRLLKSTEEGVISKIINNELIEVEIEDGFYIPVLKSEIALVSRDETKYFPTAREEVKEVSIQPEVSTGKKGVFMAFIPINDFQVTWYLINNSAHDILINWFENRHQEYTGFFADKLLTGQSVKIKTLDKMQVDQLPSYLLLVLFHFNHSTTLPGLSVCNIKLKANKLFQILQPAPVLDKPGYLHTLEFSNA